MAPIVISRNTGEIISAPVLTPEQRDAAWEAIVSAYARKHPEIFQEPPKGEEESA